MQFTLSSTDPLDTTFTDAEGHERYRTVTRYDYLSCQAETTVLSSQAPGMSTRLAKLHWGAFSPTIIEYRGNEMPGTDYLKNVGLKLRGQFIASDGLPYIWIGRSGLHALRLESDDYTRTVIAYFCRSHVAGSSCKASLTITQAGFGIVDDIVVTFIYMDQLRRGGDPWLATMSSFFPVAHRMLPSG